MKNKVTLDTSAIILNNRKFNTILNYMNAGMFKVDKVTVKIRKGVFLGVTK